MEVSVLLFRVLPLFSVWLPDVLSLDDQGEALFTGLDLEIDGYAIPDQVSDLYLRVTIPFDGARSAPTPANATKLWRAKAWGSMLKKGGGAKIDFQKQVLSDAQAATPFDLSTNPMVIQEVVFPLDLTDQDCSVVTFICIRFQRWDNGPVVLFEFGDEKLERATECVPVNCTDDPCAGIYCDIPVCPEGYYIDYFDDACCPGCVPGGPLNETEPEPGPDRCSLEQSPGPCLAYFPHYFYNPSSGACEKFIYGGCGGNDNRFEKLEDCQEACAGTDDWMIEAEIPEPRKGCDSEPCLNGGECREAFDIPICSCPDGYEGSNCEIEEGTDAPGTLPDETVTEIVDVEVTKWIDDLEVPTQAVTGTTDIGTEELIEELEELTTIVGVELVTEADEVTEVTDADEVTEIAEVTVLDAVITEEGELTTEPAAWTTEGIDIAVICGGHQEGETWELQPCERCSCIEGREICTSPSCEVECDEPLPAEGACCPVCPEPESVCEEGSEWSPDPCTQCTCADGEEVCGQVACPETGCLYPKKVAGECCKQCPNPLRARPMNIRGEVAPRIWRARRTMYPRFTLDVRTFPSSENVTGEGLWKLSIWMDTKIDGTGDRTFFKEQTLSRQQASQPLYAGQLITFSNVKVPIGGPNIDCPGQTRYYCFEFQKGDAPSVEFRFLAPRQQTSLLRCIRANCL